MRKIIPVSVFLFVVVGLLGAQDMAVATVRLEKTEPVSGNQLNQTLEAIKQQQGRDLSDEEKSEVLDQLIDQILVVQAAEADRNVTVSDAEVEQAGMRLLSQQLQAVGQIPQGAVLTDRNQYRQVLQQQGVPVAEFEGTVRKQLLVEKYITSSEQGAFQNIGSASPEELNVEYQRRVQEFVVSDSVWFNQIFFNTTESSPAEARQKGEKAREVHRELKNTSTTFSELVARESEDEMSKARGGLVGPVMKGDPMALQVYGQAFMDKLFLMDVGNVSEPMQSNVGYHILQISEKKAAQLLPQDDQEVKAYLEQIVYAAKFQQTFDEVTQKILSDLRSRATINYLGEYRR